MLFNLSVEINSINFRCVKFNEKLELLVRVDEWLVQMYCDSSIGTLKPWNTSTHHLLYTM